MAQVIIEERARGGRYESLDDLSDRVKGIGPKKAAAMQASGLTVGAGMVTRQGAADSVPPSGRPVASAAARSDEHPSELQPLMRTSTAVLCLKKTNSYKLIQYPHES